MGYNYKKAMIEDIKTYLDDNYMGPPPDMTYDEYYTQLEDDLWSIDEITGNGDSFYDSNENCKEYVGFGVEYLPDIIAEYGTEILTNGLTRYSPDKIACYIDCIIRCYLFPECLDCALHEMNYKFLADE